ncbi:MAG: MEDS domain-containing protein [Candidatus Omnitrophota bacterium]|jgi:hypothetical protein
MINYTPPTKHTSLFYNSEAEYLEIIIPYLKAGLENNELCLWVVPDTLKVKAAQAYLGKSVEDLDSYILKGQLFIGDYKNFYLKDGIFSMHKTIEDILKLEKEALEKGFKGVRGTGDCSWALDKHWFSFLMYEKELNNVIEGRKIRALCSYSLAKLDLKNIYNLGINHQSTLVRQMGSWNRIDSNRFSREDL